MIEPEAVAAEVERLLEDIPAEDVYREAAWAPDFSREEATAVLQAIHAAGIELPPEAPALMPDWASDFHTASRG